MRNFSPVRYFGFLLLLTGILTFFVVVILPYSRLIGKKQLDFPEEGSLVQESQAPSPILPIYSGLKGETETKNRSFFLTIEKLGIRRVPLTINVVVNNLKPDYLNTLLNSLAHLGGTPLPGERGNSVIFGHSALPYLYNSNNFQTIFTKLDELEFGDTVEIEAGNKYLKYKVEKGGLVPSHALLSDFASNKSRITLLSCYPPGFKSGKYAVRALLVSESR